MAADCSWTSVGVTEDSGRICLQQVIYNLLTGHSYVRTGSNLRVAAEATPTVTSQDVHTEVAISPILKSDACEQFDQH